MADGTPGLPQLDVVSYASQLFWLAIAFIALYIASSKVILPSVSDVLRRREDHKTSDLEKAEKATREAEVVKLEYTRALQEARKKANALVAETELTLKKTAETSHHRLTESFMAQTEAFEEELRTLRKETEEALRPVTEELSQLIIDKLLAPASDDGAEDEALTRAAG